MRRRRSTSSGTPSNSCCPNCINSTCEVPMRTSVVSILPPRDVMRTAICLTLFVVSLAPRAIAQERMSMIPADKMTEAQKKAVADYKALRGTDLSGPPWSVLLRVPDQVVPALQIRLHYLNRSVLGPKLTEFAILTAARRWTNNWEWSAHSTAAATAGLSADIMSAIA